MDFVDHITRDYSHVYSGESLYSKQSKFQKVEIIRNKTFGKLMLLDGKTMFSEKGEYFYHENLVHGPMLSVKNPKKILIIGGGDGGTLREVYRHPQVEKAVVAELDEEVVLASKKFFPDMAKCLDDPRTKIIYGDARAYVEETGSKFDVILIDLTDPFGPAKTVYTKEFYEKVRERLKPSGCVGLHADSPFFFPKAFAIINNTLKSVFPETIMQTTYVPEYGMPWSFVVAAEKPFNTKRMKSRSEERGLSFKCFNPDSYGNTPRELLKILETEKTISTDQNPYDMSEDIII